MTEAIGKWIASILEWAQALPPQAWAILLGILFGGVVTQWLKRTFPLAILFPKLQKHWQVMWIRSFALVCSFIPAYIIWPDDQYELWAALAIGFSTPSIYRIGSYFVYRKWPDLEARWSGTS